MFKRKVCAIILGMLWKVGFLRFLFCGLVIDIEFEFEVF
jgi:hypothetical protein